MDGLNNFIGALNGILFSDYTIYALLFTGVLFTVWSGFGQYRALTHGVAVVRGKYDDKNAPGAINHFQALSAALSATVGLGNIAGVAVAVALGGPGAIFWMWVIGVLGMSLKMTEVTQSMLYRNTEDPDNPHGGPMFVVKKGFAKWGLGPLGTAIGGLFVVTLIISAITGGNMFRAWNVADITFTYFEVPQIVTGIVLTVVVGMVIIGGIKRIGAVAGRIVPFMCVTYMLAAGYVIVMNFGEIPAMLGLIVKSGLPPFLGGESANPEGAFLGGTFAYAAMWGIKRALFSSEAGQGSSPIAHSAAKTNEPVREGVVAGLEPFIDTIVVCTLTALVILSSGAYNRGAEAEFVGVTPQIVFSSETAGALSPSTQASSSEDSWTLAAITAPDRQPTAADIKKQAEKGEELPDWKRGDSVFAYVVAQPGDRRMVLSGTIKVADGSATIKFGTIEAREGAAAITGISAASELYHGAKPAWKISATDLPRMSDSARKIRRTSSGEAGWRDKETIFMIVEADFNADTGRDLRKITGKVKKSESESGDVSWSVDWTALESEIVPLFRVNEDEDVDFGLFGDYAGASMTAYAFDRVTPGLGMVLVSVAAWLFALSTMISWSYYGEQGVYYFFGTRGEKIAKPAVLIYKLIYCLLILLTTALAMPIFGENGDKAIIGTDTELDMWTTLGLGVMLVVNIPIMLIFGAQSMKAYRDYFKRMDAGEDPPHEAPPITDVVEGHDVE